jgi:hypothetical protein
MTPCRVSQVHGLKGASDDSETVEMLELAAFAGIDEWSLEQQSSVPRSWSAARVGDGR